MAGVWGASVAEGSSDDLPQLSEDGTILGTSLDYAQMVPTVMSFTTFSQCGVHVFVSLSLKIVKLSSRNRCLTTLKTYLNVQ